MEMDVSSIYHDMTIQMMNKTDNRTHLQKRIPLTESLRNKWATRNCGGNNHVFYEIVYNLKNKILPEKKYLMYQCRDHK